MQTQEATLLQEEVDFEYPLIYELSQRGTSQWKRRGTENSKNPQIINCAKSIMLEVRSKWNAGKDRNGRNLGEVEIQYVNGAPTIFVNDYVDKDGNKQPGLRTLYGNEALKGELLRVASEEGGTGIKFENGLLYVEKYGGRENRTLCEFLAHHASNEGAPNFARKRNMNTMFLFRPLVKEKKAANQLEHLELANEVSNLYTALRTKNGKVFEYDTVKINALCAIFNTGGGLMVNESSQKMLALMPYTKDVVKFMEIYNASMKEYTTTVNLAMKFGIISLKEKEAKIKITNVTPFSIELHKSKKDENIEELIYHFLGDQAGEVTYTQIVSEVEDKKMEALNSK